MQFSNWIAYNNKIFYFNNFGNNSIDVYIRISILTNVARDESSSPTCKDAN